jgi:hypothetical protein
MERISQKPDDWGLRLAFPGRICSGYFNRMFSCTPKPHINERFLCASCFLDCALFWLSVHTEKRRLSDTMHLLLLMFRLCVQDVENDAIKSIPKSIKAKFVRTSTLLQLHPAPTAMHLVRPLLFPGAIGCEKQLIALTRCCSGFQRQECFYNCASRVQS